MDYGFGVRDPEVRPRGALGQFAARRRRRILLADDQELVLVGVRRVLEGYEGYEIAGEAVDRQKAVALCRELRPDIVVFGMDLQRGGLAAVRELAEEHADLEILVLSAQDSDELIREALGVGAKAFLLKSAPVEELRTAVEHLAEGRAYLTERVSRVLLDKCREGRMPGAEPKGIQLTLRERETLRLVAMGKTNKEIASLLGISVRTVESHRSNIMEKMDFRTMTDVLRFALRAGLV